MHKVALLGLCIALNLTAADSGDRAVALLQQRCSACHGEKMAMSGLRLDSRAAALKGGVRGPAVAPGAPNESRLWLAVIMMDFQLNGNGCNGSSGQKSIEFRL